MAQENKQNGKSVEKAKDAQQVKAQSKEQPAKPMAATGKDPAVKQGQSAKQTKRQLPQFSGAKFKRLLIHFIGYGAALVLILGLGFFYYRLVINANHLELQQQQIAAQLEETASASQHELNRLKQELQTLRQSQTGSAEQLRALAESRDDTDARMQAIQEQLGTEELWRLQLGRTLYLAEQQRILGGSPRGINYLLLEAEQLLLNAPGTDTVVAQLRELIRRDLRRYASLADINTELIYRDLRTLEQLSGKLEFKPHFYQDELQAAGDATADPSDAPAATEPPTYRKILDGFYREFNKYLRISKRGDAELDFTRHNRDLILSNLLLHLSQAKHSLLKGEVDIYYTIIGDAKRQVIASFVDSNDRDTVVDLLDELSAADIIPEELPPLDSYDYFFDD